MQGGETIGPLGRFVVHRPRKDSKMGTRMIIALAALAAAGLVLPVPGNAKTYVPRASQELSAHAPDTVTFAVPHRLSFWPSINWSKVANNSSDDWLSE
jgi:hypothetical protein